MSSVRPLTLPAPPKRLIGTNAEVTGRAAEVARRGAEAIAIDSEVIAPRSARIAPKPRAVEPVPRGHRTGERGQRIVLTTSSPRNRWSPLRSRRATHSRGESCALDRSVHRTVLRGRRSGHRDHSTGRIDCLADCDIHSVCRRAHRARRSDYCTEVHGHCAGPRSQHTRRAALRNRPLSQDDIISPVTAPVLPVSGAKRLVNALPPPVVACDSFAVASVAVAIAHARSPGDCRRRLFRWKSAPCGSSVVREFRRSGVPPFGSSAVREFRRSGVPSFGSSVVREFRRSGIPPFGSYRVNTRGPSSVIATVCSKCAESDPSSVTIVQRSASVFVAGPPMFTIGSIAMVSPTDNRSRRFGFP